MGSLHHSSVAHATVERAVTRTNWRTVGFCPQTTGAGSTPITTYTQLETLIDTEGETYARFEAYLDATGNTYADFETGSLTEEAVAAWWTANP